MSARLPASIDAWRAVAGRRTIAGTLPLTRLQRLSAALAESRGEVEYSLEFGKDEPGVAFVAVRARTRLPLLCQRTLEVFDFPVEVDTRLGLIAEQNDDAGLPAGYEPLLVGDHGLAPADVVEDELLLALPLIPMKPGSNVEPQYNSEIAAPEPTERNKPFAVLGALKNK